MTRRMLGWMLAATSLAGLSLAGVGCSEESNAPVLPGVQSIVFVKRANLVTDAMGSRVVDMARYVPAAGNGVFVLSPPTADGVITDLTRSFEDVDIQGLDISYDARQVVFAMRDSRNTHYQLFLANVDGTGDIRQLTFGEWDSLDPAFITQDRIAFVTNQPYTELGRRADEYNHGRSVTQIGFVTATGGEADLRVCSQNLSHSLNPFPIGDGTVGFSRWEHLGPVNDVKLFRMNPDCTGIVALAGQHGKPSNSIYGIREITGRVGEYIGTGSSRSGSLQAGALVRIDARNLGGNAAIAFNEQAARFTVLTPDVDVEAGSAPGGRYRYPKSIPEIPQLLVSWASGDVNERNEIAGTAPNFGLFLFDPARNSRTLIYDDPGYSELWGTAVAARVAPPEHPGVLLRPDPNMPATIGSIDVTQTSLEESVRGGGIDGSLRDSLRQATKMRIIEGKSSEIGAVGMFGLTMHEGGSIVGEVPVYQDGSWLANIPPYIPVHLQPIDRFGLAIRNQLTWIQAMPGEVRTCGGCHEDRGNTVLPRGGSPMTMAAQVGAVNVNRNFADRLAGERPWMNSTIVANMQDTFTNKCASCHSGGAGDPFAGRSYTMEVITEDGERRGYNLPYLDLSARMLRGYYDMEEVEYPAAYMTLGLPGSMMGEATVTGDIPDPPWVDAANARGSRLIAKMNINAEDDPNAWAYPTPAHPEDQGSEYALTREERMRIIQSVDMGFQYYGASNVAGGDYWMGPSYPSP